MMNAVDEHGEDVFVTINTVPTRIVQFGHLNDNPDTIVLFISGNPGEVAYYRKVMANIHHRTRLPVLGVSHAGHNVMTGRHTIPSINSNQHLYSLEGQILHKKCFIDDHIPNQSKLILIGHSIGCYMILELLHRYQQIQAKVLHSILIFPTIELMGQTSEAVKYEFIFKWFKYPLLGLSYVLNQLSDYYKQKLVSMALSYGGHRDVPECVTKSATNLLHPNCLRALIYMSLIEFKTVNDLNKQAIESNEKTLTLLYGKCDQWCPVDYCYRIQRLYPNADIRLCLEDMNHAFVICPQSTDKVCQLVVQQISSITSNKL